MAQAKMADTKLNDEPARLAAIKRYDILDTPAEPAFDRITELVRSILGVPISVVSLVDDDRQWFKSHVGVELEGSPRNVAFCDHTIRQRTPLIVKDAREDNRFSCSPLVTNDPHMRSYAGVPLKTPDGYNVGSLCAIDTVPREFDAVQIEILKKLAALTVEQLELRRIAERDHLTGALTRRAFIEEMTKSITLFERCGRPASLLMFDIDHFKRVNDSYGHPAGDKVLHGVASLCATLKRPSDTLGRLGGEEFGILLPETDDNNAVKAAQRFCNAIAAHRVAHDPPLQVTASFGTAQVSDSRLTIESWLAAADAALYEAKHGGRNRVVKASQYDPDSDVGPLFSVVS